MTKKIVITGMGVVTPNANSVSAFWEANLQGKSGLRFEERMDLSALPCGWVTGSVPDSTKDVIKARWGQSNRAWGDILMHEALSQALDDAAFDGALKRTAGLVWTRVWPGPSGSFPQDYVDYMNDAGERHDAVGDEPGDIIEYLQAKRAAEPLEASDLSAFPTELSTRLGVPLIAAKVDATCAGGLRSVIEAKRLLELGKVDFVVVAAVVSRTNHYTLSQYAQLMALSRWKGAPEQACMPFDKRRSGMVINESSGAIILETEEHARARGIREVYAEVGGWGLAVDTVHLTAPRVEMVERVMRSAIDRSNMTPTDIDMVNAHGTSTRLNDITEAKALHKVFGERMDSLDVCAVKSLTGHGSAASGVLETVVSALSLCEGVVPPVVTCTQPDPDCNVKTSLTPIRRPISNVLKNSFGFGGQYASMVFSRPENARSISLDSRSRNRATQVGDAA
jgi:3-oxoacyl-[acyl-carrier-protein] synthase II